MAGYNEIGVARYNRVFQKLFQMKGGAPVPTLGGDIQPGFQVFNGAENRYLETWQRFSYFETVPGVAAQFTTSRLRNPVGSNLIAVMERIVVAAIAAADQPALQGQASTADLAIVAHSPAERWDPRGSNASALIRSNNTAGSPAVAFFNKMLVAMPLNSTADFIIDSIHEIPLLPGDAIQVQGNVLAQNLNVSWMWRERFLEESERS